MQPLVLAGLAFGLSQVALSLLLLWQKPGWGLTERLYALLLLAVSAYLFSPLLVGSPLAWLFSSMATAVPGFFWLLSACVFGDDFRLRPWQLGLVAATVLLPLLGFVLRAEGALHWVLVSLPQLLEFLLLGLALWVVARHWRVDLVESRRRLRWWFVAINGVYLFALLLLRELFFPAQSDFAQWQYVTVGLVLLLMNGLLLQYKPDALFAGEGEDVAAAAEASPGENPLPDADPDLVARLQALMGESRAYRQMSLTLGQLAEQLQVPQYRLRKTINSGLGFRNFNDFLNSYRIAEAAQRLADPGEAALPVLTIAMDAGFRSLSSFNKAFKDTQGVTPTTYRKQSRQ
jgi:AraC-like DNA-binding protein